jgi:hypothetical protein
VVVIGVRLGWIVHEAHIQRDAVAAIKKAGGADIYDWECRDGNKIPRGQPWAPRWLVDLIGVDCFGRVTAVQLSRSSAPTDAALAHVGRLSRLQVLFDHSLSISDAGLAHLKGLASLCCINLDGTHLTDAGLLHLQRD